MDQENGCLIGSRESDLCDIRDEMFKKCVQPKSHRLGDFFCLFLKR